ncbi:hypothetical protein CFOL_v3_28485, partial [Cephalotus follicularis]
GLQLHHSRVSKATFKPLVAKIQQRLSGWKAKVLNLAGRATLIQSATSSNPFYSMQTQPLPLSTCDSIDKLNINFLWNDWPDAHKIHLVNWETVCKQKNFGGLGIRNMRVVNEAALAKLGWQI